MTSKQTHQVLESFVLKVYAPEASIPPGHLDVQILRQSLCPRESAPTSSPQIRSDAHAHGIREALLRSQGSPCPGSPVHFPTQRAGAQACPFKFPSDSSMLPGLKKCRSRVRVSSAFGRCCYLHCIIACQLTSKRTVKRNRAR